MVFNTSGKSGVIVILLCSAMLSTVIGDETLVSGTGAPVKAHRAQWLADSSYGVMVHYIVSPKAQSQEGKTTELNQTVDNFDLDLFIKQFEQTGADWLIFTIGQISDYYCSPNAWLDQRKPGHTSRRDLVSEIGKKLKERNKRMIAYIPCHVLEEGQLEEVFGYDRRNLKDFDEFQNRYLKFLEVYSRQYGKLVDGWWVDGCYSHRVDGWDWNRWNNMLRTGNPNAIIAYNDGAFCLNKLSPLTPLQDYHAGEVHLLENAKIRTDFVWNKETYKNEYGKLRAKGVEPQFFMPDSQFIEGVLMHALVPVDSSFGAPSIPDQSYSDDELFTFVKNFKSVGGAVTLNLPIDMRNGHIPEKTIEQCHRLSKALSK